MFGLTYFVFRKSQNQNAARGHEREVKEMNENIECRRHEHLS